MWRECRAARRMESKDIPVKLPADVLIGFLCAQVPDGFISHFYAISEHVSPVLAFGFLGPRQQLREVCTIFKVRRDEHEAQGHHVAHHFPRHFCCTSTYLLRNISKLLSQRKNVSATTIQTNRKSVIYTLLFKSLGSLRIVLIYLFIYLLQEKHSVFQ